MCDNSGRVHESDIQTSTFKEISEILNTFIAPREHNRAPLLALLIRTYSALSLTKHKDALPTLPASAASSVVSAAAASTAASTAAFVQACCWFLTAQQIRFAGQRSSVLTWTHLIAASSAKSSPSSFLGAAPQNQPVRDSPTYEASTMCQG